MEMIKERITNIVKRLTFEYFTVTDFDNIDSNMFSLEVTNNITKQTYDIHLPYDMLERWYSFNNLKYDLIKEYILTNISEDYYASKEDIYEKANNK